MQIAAQPTLGGGERHVLDLSAGLRDAGWRLLLVCPGEGELSARARTAGLETAIIPRPAGAAGFPAALVKVIRTARAARPALVHGHSGYGNLIARVTAGALGVPCVVTWHGLHPVHKAGMSARLELAAERALKRAAAVHICVSRADEASLRAKVGVAPERLVQIYSGVPFPAAPPASGGGGARLITVARFHPPKDFDTLFEAVRLLAAEHPGISLDAYGFGPERARLAALRDRLGLAARIRLIAAPHDEIMRAYERYDAFVLATRWEGLPYTVLEALSRGVPVVASNVGGIPEQITPGVTGELAAAGSAPALAAALARVLAARAVYASGIARSWGELRARFDLGAMVAQTADVYRSVLDG